MLGVSVDPPDKIRTALEKMEKKVPGPGSATLLSDLDHTVIARYGLLNMHAAANKRFVPHPATFVIGKDGSVAWKFIEVDYKVRPSNQVVLEAIRTASTSGAR